MYKYIIYVFFFYPFYSISQSVPFQLTTEHEKFLDSIIEEKILPNPLNREFGYLEKSVDLDSEFVHITKPLSFVCVIFINQEFKL